MPYTKINLWYKVWRKLFYVTYKVIFYVTYKVTTLAFNSYFSMITRSSGGPQNGWSLVPAVILVALHQPPATTGKGHSVVISPSRRKKALWHIGSTAHINGRAITHDQHPHQHSVTVKNWNNLYIYHTFVRKMRQFSNHSMKWQHFQIS
jgi:hypothetical protein